MSVAAFYRVMVRMLYDAEFTRAVYSDRDASLAGIDLAPAERAWLVAPDPRAWRTDGLRRSRSLAGLIEEFPVASAFALRRGREGVARLDSGSLDAFFSHAIFHRCLQEGGSMVFAFGRYLEEPSLGGVASDPRIAPLARLEAAIARLRRIRDPREGRVAGRGYDEDAIRPGALLRIAPWAELMVLPAGTSELHARVAKALRAKERSPAATALDRRWSLPVLLDLGFALLEHVLVERPPEPGVAWAAASVRQAPVTRELAGLLRVAEAGATRETLMAAARDLGAEDGTEAEIVDGLTTEGILRPDASRGRSE